MAFNVIMHAHAEGLLPQYRAEWEEVHNDAAGLAWQGLVWCGVVWCDVMISLRYCTAVTRGAM